MLSIRIHATTVSFRGLLCRHACTEAVFEERARTRSINVYGFLDLSYILKTVLERILYKKYTKHASLNEIRVFYLRNTLNSTFERNLSFLDKKYTRNLFLSEF